MSTKDFKQHMLNELRELERLIRNDCARDNGEFDSYEPEELKWFDKLHEMQELCYGKKATNENAALPLQSVVQQRELLTAFSDWMFMQHYHEPPARELINEYLGGL